MKLNALFRLLRFAIPAVALMFAAIPSAFAAIEAGDVTPDRMIIVSGSPGGTHYYMGTGVAKIINDSFDGVSCTVETTSGAPVENAHYVARDAHTMGMGTLDGLGNALKGDKALGFPRPLDNLALIVAGHTQYNYLVTLASSNIFTIADMRGLKAGSLSKGSSVRTQAEAAIREGGGLDPDKDVRIIPLSFTEQVDAIKDNNIQVMTCGGGSPQASIMELSTGRPVRLLDIPADAQARILAQQPDWSFTTIPGGTYKGQDTDVSVISVQAVMFGQRALSEQFVYDLVKVLYENSDVMASVHPDGSKWTYESTLRLYQSRPDLPWHPGTVKYITEREAK